MSLGLSASGAFASPAGEGPRGRLPAGMGLWGACFAVVLAVHLALAGYALAPGRELAEGAPGDAISIDLAPDPSEQAEKPDEVAGPQMTDTTASTSETKEADDPDPPAPDAPPPTEVKRKPETTTPEATAPEAPASTEAVLPRPAEEPPKVREEERPPEPTPPETKPEVTEKAPEERQTAPSQASSGSAAVLSGGRRPSAAAQATWRGSVGQHLGRRRRYPSEARAAGLQGTARVRVTIDADGHVLSRDLVQSSGKPALDGEALDLMRRADPFPKPPPGLPMPVAMTVPVVFAIR